MAEKNNGHGRDPSEPIEHKANNNPQNDNTENPTNDPTECTPPTAGLGASSSDINAQSTDTSAMQSFDEGVPSEDIPIESTPPNASPSENSGVDPLTSGTSSDCEDILAQFLGHNIPDDVTVDFTGDNTSPESIIQQANEVAMIAIIKSYMANETARVNRQRALLWAVVILTAIQLLFFNGIIGVVVWGSFKNGHPDVVTNLFSILKYYIGATVAELIGMIVFITKGTFSSSHIETMKMLLQRKKD